MFRNDGGHFVEIANAAGAAGKVGAPVGQQAGTSEGVAMADYDLDGFLDLFVTNGNNMLPKFQGGPKELFRNRGNGNRWLQFDLQGTSSNRDGVGSQIYVRTGTVTQYREQNGGYHRWSQNFQRVHVGLARHTSATVSVRWPNGVTVSYGSLAADRLYRLRPGRARERIEELSRVGARLTPGGTGRRQQMKRQWGRWRADLNCEASRNSSYRTV